MPFYLPNLRAPIAIPMSVTATGAVTACRGRPAYTVRQAPQPRVENSTSSQRKVGGCHSRVQIPWRPICESAFMAASSCS